MSLSETSDSRPAYDALQAWVFASFGRVLNGTELLTLYGLALDGCRENVMRALDEHVAEVDDVG